MIPKIHIVRTADGADFPLPSYTSRHHLGLNLMAAIAGPIKIGPRERVRVPIGFAIAIPDGLCGQIVSNRELAETSGIIVLDAPCVVHPADREPLFVLLRNESSEQFILRRGMKIAQLLLFPAVQATWQEVKTDVGHGKVSDIVVEESFEETKEGADKPKIPEKRVKVSIRERTAK